MYAGYNDQANLFQCRNWIPWSKKVLFVVDTRLMDTKFAAMNFIQKLFLILNQPEKTLKNPDSFLWDFIELEFMISFFIGLVAYRGL